MSELPEHLRRDVDQQRARAKADEMRRRGQDEKQALALRAAEQRLQTAAADFEALARAARSKVATVEFSLAKYRRVLGRRTAPWKRGWVVREYESGTWTGKGEADTSATRGIGLSVDGEAFYFDFQLTYDRAVFDLQPERFHGYDPAFHVNRANTLADSMRVVLVKFAAENNL